MSDKEIASHIEQLVDEEHQLRQREAGDSSDPDALGADQDRLTAIGIELDRCWDLLRRRRAMRDVGGDPDIVEPRDTGTVEGYLQ